MTVKEKEAKTSQKNKFKSRYMDAKLMGNEPSSVYAFCKALKIKESTFYKSYNSLDALEDAIWEDWFRQTVDIIENDTQYSQFAAREKILAFYYTWFEGLLEHRSFASMSLKKLQPQDLLQSTFIHNVRGLFTSFTGDIIKEGVASGEIPKRPEMINKSYPNLMWFQFLFLLNFWRTDRSNDFASTDAAIEKSVNLAFDFIGTSPIDGMVDFAKFMFQQSNLK
jgi:AcrR family transcriptional regulator